MNTDLTIEDFKALTFELYLAQRENTLLRERVRQLEAQRPAAQPADSLESA